MYSLHPASSLPRCSGERRPQSLDCTSRFVSHISSRIRRVRLTQRELHLRDEFPVRVAMTHLEKASFRHDGSIESRTSHQSDGCHALLQCCCINMYDRHICRILRPFDSGKLQALTPAFLQYPSMLRMPPRPIRFLSVIALLLSTKCSISADPPRSRRRD